MADLIPLDAGLASTLEDVAGQIGQRSKRIYGYDAMAFSDWLRDQALSTERLTRSDMIRYRVFLGEHYAKATAQRMFSVARRILKEQVVTGKLDRDPSDGLKGFKTNTESTHHALMLPEVKQLLAAVDRSTNLGKRDYAILMLLVRTGIRRFECTALTFEDMQKEQGHHIAVVEHGKGDERGIVKIPVDVFRCIQEYIEASGRQNMPPQAPLFVPLAKGGKSLERKMSEKLVEKIVQTYSEKAGLPILTPHDLRTTFITLALEEGVPLQKVQYAARHKDPRTTERYQKRKINLDDNAVDYIHL